MKRGLGPVEEAILGLLRDGREDHGLGLVARSAGVVKRGAVYVVLHRLEAQAFVTSRVEPDEARAPGQRGLARRLYTITEHGQRALCAWEAAAEILSKPPISPRGP